MTKAHQIKNTVLVLTAAALLSACAPRGAANSSDLSSRTTDTTTSSTKPLAYCNQASASGITAKLRAYVDPNTNKVRPEYMLAKITVLPYSFTSDAAYISMWKWMSNSAGTTYLNSTALSFYIVNPSTGVAITNWKTTLRWADVKTAAAALGYSDATSFFAAMKIVVNLQDTAGEYDVLRISMYDLSTNKSNGQVDALMPLFHANPADYAVESTGTARASSLQALHPFKGYANAGYTSSQFSTMANDFCF